MSDSNNKSLLVVIGERLGVPFLITGILLFMAREGLTSVHRTVVLPFIESHTSFLESASKTLDRICAVQERQADVLDALTEGQSEIRHAVMAREKE
jgi:hypothetical protein